MLRTNCKIVRNRIRTYIREGIDFDYFEDYQDNNLTESGRDADIAELLLNEFDRVCGSPYDIRRIPNNSDRFHDYMCGLPSCIDSSYVYNCSAIDLVGDILDQTEAERIKHTETESEHLMSYLIYRELLAMAKRK